MRFFNYHAPDEVRLFLVPPGGVRRWDDQAVVYDVQIGRDRILRRYSFAHRWFEVNCSLDLHGRFVTEPGPIDWCFNCDISTPHFRVGADVYNMDLWLDVLVAPNGREHAVIDEDDLAEAIRLGWPTELEQAGARAGLADLLGVIKSQGLVGFLDQVCPFVSVSANGEQPPMERMPVAGFPWLRRGEREKWFGRNADSQ